MHRSLYRRQLLFRILAGLLLFCVPGDCYLHASEWEIQVVDPGGGGSFTTLLVDKNGNGHAAYVDEASHVLKYAFWDHVSKKWFIMPVDSASGFASMALDSQQRPHISYLAYGARALKYAHFVGAGWSTQLLPIAAKQIEFYTSIALDAQDRPMITFYETVGAEDDAYDLHLRTVRWTGKFWALSTIDWTPGSGKFNSVLTSAKGELAAAYANVSYVRSGLRYAQWDGHGWAIDTIEGGDGPHPIQSVNAILDSRGVPHIVYSDVSKKDAEAVKYAVRVGNTWKIETVDALGAVAYPDRNSIALDARGTPYVSYYDGSMGVLKLAHREANKWKVEVVDQGFAGYTSSLQVTQNEIVIIYFDSATNSLKCARRPLNVGDTGIAETAEPSATKLLDQRPKKH